MTKKNLEPFFVLLIFIIFNSCKKEELSLPSYIHVPEIKLSTLASQGSARHNFKDIWIFIDGFYIGAYEVPFTIPVVTDVESEIEMFIGIRENGVLTHPKRYSNCDAYKFKYKFIDKDTLTVIPQYTYVSQVMIPFNENFESLHYFNEDRDGDLNTKMVNSGSQDAFEGTNSGLIELTSVNPFIETWYDFDRKIPISTDPIYLEFHYKSDIPFSIGFISFKGGFFDQKLINATVLPKSEWTRVYFDFREILNSSEATSYKLAITSTFANNIDLPKQRILIDNLKVIHR